MRASWKAALTSITSRSGWRITNASPARMFELRLLCPEEGVEPVGEALEALDALSVSVEDADAHTDSEQALFGEPGLPPPKAGWQRSRVTALFESEVSARDAGRILGAQDFFEGCEIQSVSPVPDEDWV